MKNFWSKLKKPFTILAPMDGVTDVVFRNIINDLKRPDVFFTEFTSVEGLNSKGVKNTLDRFKFSEEERPIVAQIWGINPINFYKSAKLISELGFSGIDINMGCPDRSVIKKGTCSALIKNHELAKVFIDETRRGANGLPVSVKTRLGFSKIEIEEWIGFLLKQKLAVITIHLRTVSELSKVDAHWELMGKIIELRNKISPETLIIGNGDVVSFEQMEVLFDQYGCDGFMVGRGIFYNPWIFDKGRDISKISIQEKIGVYKKHIELFDQTWGESKNPAIVKKFCKVYINDVPNAQNLRDQIMEVRELREILDILEIQS